MCNVTCSSCGKEYDSNQAVCPSCGAWTTRPRLTAPKTDNKQTLVRNAKVVGVVMMFALILAMLGFMFT